MVCLCSMKALPTPSIVLPLRPLRPLPKPEPRFAPDAQGGSLYQLVDAEMPAVEDANDWIVVQRYEAPGSSVPSCSDTASAPRACPGPSAATVQPRGELDKTSKACSAGDGGAKEPRSPATGRSVGGDSHGLHHGLGPWAPVNAGSYDSDVLGIGVWAMDVVGQTYAECLADL